MAIYRQYGCIMRLNALRTIGNHSFLTLPHANSRILVAIRINDIPNDYSEYKMTPRQAHTLLNVLELHARLLRANMWGCEDNVFDTWVADRRTDVANPDSGLI